MVEEVVVPLTGLGEGKGKIIRWLKAEGDNVNKGDVLFELETDKVVTEVESPASGVLRKILIGAGAEVPVGTVIAYITAVNEELPDEFFEQDRSQQEVITSAASNEVLPIASEISQHILGEGIRATPLVRKLAKEHGIDLSEIKGTGPGGRINTEDVIAVVNRIKAPIFQPIVDQHHTFVEKIEPLSSMREIIARKMTESFQAPHFYLTIEIDALNLKETREQLLTLIKNKTGIDITITDLIILAVAKAIEDNQKINCAYINGNIKYFGNVDIGLVTAIEEGLLVPVIRNANRSSLAEITKNRAELVGKARERKLTKQEMSNSTFTISNLGMFGIDNFSAILQPPESAILAVGRISEKVVSRDGQIVIRPVMAMTLSIDHRILDGKIGAEFLQSVKRYLENPVVMLA